MMKLNFVSQVLLIPLALSSAAQAANLQGVIQKGFELSHSLSDDGQSLDTQDLDQIDTLLSQAIQLAVPRFSLTFTLKSGLNGISNPESRYRVAAAASKNGPFLDLQSLAQKCMAITNWPGAAQCFNSGLAHTQDSNYIMDTAAGRQLTLTMCLAPLNWDDSKSCFVGAVNVLGRHVKDQSKSCQNISDSQTAAHCFRDAIQNS